LGIASVAPAVEQIEHAADYCEAQSKPKTAIQYERDEGGGEEDRSDEPEWAQKTPRDVKTVLKWEKRLRTPEDGRRSR
jgi:hypothetical protein